MGYCIIMFDFFGFRQAFGLPKTFGLIGSSLLFYGLYFGVLDRDCAEMCADRIQQRLGYAKKGDDDPQRLLPDNICALCGLELRPATGAFSTRARDRTGSLQQPNDSEPTLA